MLQVLLLQMKAITLASREACLDFVCSLEGDSLWDSASSHHIDQHLEFEPRVFGGDFGLSSPLPRGLCGQV